LEAAILSRIRSEVTSRSNWAKDSHRRRRVELLGDRDEGHVMGIEQFDQLCKIGK
jgi:hypothetical protein